MKIIIIILLGLLIVFCSCSKGLYKEYSFKQKGIRELNIYFTNDTLGKFRVKYLCADTLINIEQKFTYKRISENRIYIKKIINHGDVDEPFIIVPLEKLSSCIKSNKFSAIERIPVVNEEEITIYKKKLFWQKNDNEKIVTAFIFIAKR